MLFKVHSMFINLYQLKARRGAEERVTIATLVPEEDTLNSCTRSLANFLSKLKFLDPITELLGMTRVRCIRGGKRDSKRKKNEDDQIHSKKISKLIQAPQRFLCRPS